MFLFLLVSKNVHSHMHCPLAESHSSFVALSLPCQEVMLVEVMLELSWLPNSHAASLVSTLECPNNAFCMMNAP